MQPAEVNQSAAGTTMRTSAAGWTHRLTLAVIVAVGATFRLLHLASKPFWFDECFSVEAGRIDWRNFLHLLWWREANMSLYYVLLRAWLHFGHSAFFIRGLSVAISAASMLAIYWLADLLYNRRVALAASALLAVNVYDIRYAQEARSYALFVLLATLSSAFLISWLREPSRKSWRGYVFTSILAVYAHFYALLLLVAHWSVLRWAGRPGKREQASDSTASGLRRAWAIIAIGVLPLLIFVAKTGAGPIRWIQRPGFLEMMKVSIYITNGFPVIYFAACLATLLPLKNNLLERNGKWETWRVHFLYVWLLLPPMLTLALSFARPVFLPRYMIFCLPALLILTAAGLTSVPPRWLSMALVGGTLLLSFKMIPYVYDHDFDTERDASGAATAFILDHSQPGDAILFHIAETRVPYEFYRSVRAGQDTASPNYAAALGPDILFPRHGAGLDYRDFTGKPTADFVRGVVPSHRRVWVMLMNNGPAEKPDPTTIMLAQVLPGMFQNVQHWEFPRVEVLLYSK